MKKEIKIYIENSVIGGYFDKEFAEPTQQLFGDAHVTGTTFP